MDLLASQWPLPVDREPRNRLARNRRELPSAAERRRRRDSADLSRRHFRVNSANAPVMAPREGEEIVPPVLRILCRTA